MKKLILILVAITSCCVVRAQTTKGTIAITGTVGYTASDGKTVTGNTQENRYEGSSYTLSPEIGLFVKDNLVVGVTTRFFKDENNYFRYNDGINTYHSNIIHHGKEVGLYVKQYKYFLEKLAVTGTLSFGVSNLDYQTILNHSAPFQHYNIEEDITRMWAALSPGLTFFASKKLALNMNFGALRYSSQIMDYKYSRTFDETGLEDPDTSEYTEGKGNLSLDFSSMHLNFGLTYFLGK